jgi:murein tripeptide amidase MpaA
MSIVVDSGFEAGNIELVDISSNGNIQVNIRKDNNAEFMQWFYFSIAGIEHKQCNVTFLNASQCSYPKGWEEYNVCASYDNENWFRLPSNYDGNVLETSFQVAHEQLYLAYFPPYNMNQQEVLINKVLQSEKGALLAVEKSPQGNNIPVLKIGQNGAENKRIWIIARQHPGESQGSYFVEEVLKFLTTKSRSLAQQLLSKAVFYIVPNINPDGSIKGNLRTNALGQNLNREWDKDSSTCAPEVHYVREQIHNTGVDLFLDIHGDEVLPYLFAAGSEGINNSTSKMLTLNTTFTDKLVNLSADFQVEYGYPKNKPGTANLGLATNYIASTFQCHALTIEMPFKDNKNNPDNKNGWSISRCKQFAQEMLLTIDSIVDEL